QAGVPSSALAGWPVIELVVVASIVTVQCGAAAALASTPARTVTPGATCWEVHATCPIQPPGAVPGAGLAGAAAAGMDGMTPSSGRPAIATAAGKSIRRLGMPVHLRRHGE